MIHLIRAELAKMIMHRWLIGFTIWIFPMGIGVFALCGVITVLIVGKRADAILSNLIWTEQMLGSWIVPIDLFAQMLPMAFAATWFAGEAQWGTWKNIIPLARRWRIMVAKIIAILIIFFIVFNITAIVAASGSILVIRAAGLIASPPLNTETISAFLPQYAATMLISLVTLLLIAILGAIGGLLAHATLAATLFGFAAFALMKAMIVPLGFLMALFNADWLADLYRLTPIYNLDNAKAWLLGGVAFDFPRLTIDPNVPPDSLLFSIVLLAFWIVALIALMLYIALKRDIVV